MLCMRNEMDSDILYCSSYYIRIEAIRLGNADANAMSSSKTFLVIIPRSQCPSSAQRVVLTNFIKANDWHCANTTGIFTYCKKFSVI
ncbi:hypothetical protein AGABI1DRAFT_87021 [Agaricus bisporus var. burnettii JB137-S8]|uniref:Uncharacterized protein n=1 Tax=Agaricus bisporus var. burnettii (strain JB137-S8 / ATCC MYA-4627 / FGSC 10392) TaxID=597362 RepID=K5XPT1_AGABU|nr:uncharacterized protein AGABI1DRAFT_87021 [Agaricus bisporus var. burnettii JB137-S8]EKM76740.1 hypothetical protein AGABI1DRAFT_87021 [Agaricus bisporus var. burnettii JB137-S8]